MRRFFIVIFILFLIVSCRGSTNQFIRTLPTYLPTAPSPTHTPVSPSFTSTKSPTITPSLPPTTSTPEASATPTPGYDTFKVLYHPDDHLYVGDQVSFEVISPTGLDLKDAKLQIQIDPPNGVILGPVSFNGWGIQGREEATLLWSWDTSEQTAGTHTLDFSIQPHDYSWTEQVTLLPASDMPLHQAVATWESIQSQCCTIFYITNTASERDLATLTAEIDEQANLSIEEMDANFNQPITITVLPRLLGHGGFASNEISVSYLDRNYAANSWSLVVHHEMIHMIDGQLGGDFRPTMFLEGLAVYMAGGHYKSEPLMPRAAALLPDYLDWYIPLDTLSNDFYASQHEIGYLEGASLIEYMVETYGWEAFSAFYRDIHMSEGQSQSDAIDSALKAHFSISFAELEQDYLSALASRTDTSQWVDDVRLSVTYFDTLRHYQQLLDPSAYFRTAWLMDNKTMRERGIVADYLRHPSTTENLALETMFITASQHMTRQQYTQALQTLDEISSVMDAIDDGHREPFSVSLLATDYLTIASAVLEKGYEVQSISIKGDSASAQVTEASGSKPEILLLTRTADGWQIP